MRLNHKNWGVREVAEIPETGEQFEREVSTSECEARFKMRDIMFDAYERDTEGDELKIRGNSKKNLQKDITNEL